MKQFFILILLITSGISFAQENVEEISEFEIRSYTPQKTGMKDLIFEARIDNLTEILAKNLVLGKLVDVSFKIYWISPAQYLIEVYGLPKGFAEIRADLISLIKGKLEFVLPESFSDKFKGYVLKSELIEKGKLIRAIDATYSMASPEIDIIFDKAGQLKTIETKAAMSAVKSEFFHSSKAWSNNKLVLDKVVLTSKRGAMTQLTVNDISYLSVNGIGFPSLIKVKNTTEVVIPKTNKEKEKKVKSESGTIIRFTKYEVNTGKALKHMNDEAKK